MFWFLGFSFLLILKFSSTKAVEEGTFFVVTQNDKNTKVAVLKSLKTTSQFQCTHRCKILIGCENINYNLKTKECELLGGNPQNEEKNSVELADNWMTTSVVQQCSKHKAEIDGRCPVLYYTKEFAISKNNLLATIDTWSKSWKISFNIKPLSIRSDWGSILHLTIGNDDSVYGDRVPALFFHEQSTNIHYGSAINGNVNHYFAAEKNLPLNAWTHIEISQLYQSDGKYLYSLLMNGTVDNSIINNEASQFKNVKVFAGNPWYEPAIAQMSNLLIKNYL